MMSEEILVSEDSGGVCYLRLNRPEAMNALSIELIDHLIEELIRVEKDPEIKVLVLTGTGAAFCAGADLKSTAQVMEPGQPDAVDRIVTLFNTLRAMPMPVIAAINGITLAGGLELLMCCDIVYAARSAIMGDGHANYGVFPGGGGAAVLPRLIPPCQAKELLFTGGMVDVQQMMQWGLINRVCDDDELIPTVDKLAKTISEKSPLVLKRMKAIANRSQDKSLEDALRDELLMLRDHGRSFDLREGLDAFINKRKPNFKGY